VQNFDVIVIGAGAAGMMCGAVAGQRGRKVALLDHSEKIGRKILISGGGRCNFTNINAGPDAFVSNNPHFCKSALACYTPDDFISLVKKYKIPFHEKKLGQLFCDHSAGDIVDLLVTECERAGNKFFLPTSVRSISKEDHFVIDTTSGTFTCESIVIATGGLSIPQIGATGFGYQIAEQFGLKIVKTRPALDGFVFTDADLKQFLELTGVSLDTIVSVDSTSFRENILFTHTGLSGPASLQASLYWAKGEELSINLLPTHDAYSFLSKRQAQGSNVELKNIMAEFWPKRFAERFCQMYLPSQPLNKIPPKKLQEFSDLAHNWKVIPGKTVGYKKAEVTRGGVDTGELSSKTMESRKCPGLYFIGEVVDVTGRLGGYNFQWAWASGYAAGQSV
jgi:predicted Rossmann fold flavoprotein